MISRQGSEITTKTTSSRPWKEVNDEISAKMIAASSDSPPLIPKKDKNDSGRTVQRPMSQSRINKSGPRSYNTTSDCSSTVDDSRHLIDTSRASAAIQQEQILNAENLQLAPYMPPGFEYPAPPPGMFFDPNFPPVFFPPPPPPGVPMFMPPYMQPVSGGGPFFPPPKPPTGHQDFEMFTYRRKTKTNNKKHRQKRRSRSLELNHGPPGSMHPNPFMPPPPPPPAFFGCPPMPYGPIPPPMQNYHMFAPPPMLALEGGPPGDVMKPEVYENQNPHPADPYIQPFPMIQPESGFMEPQPTFNNMIPTSDFPGNYTMKKGDPNTMMNGLGEFGPDENPGKISKKERDAEKQQRQQIDLKSCCKGFSQILWLILSIVLVGLILGLVLGLTLV